jgi:hypothetical protein
MRDASSVRTTLNLEDDVLASAKAVALQQRRPLGEVISALLRKSLEPATSAPAERNGLPLFPLRSGASRVTPEIVQQLLEETK